MLQKVVFVFKNRLRYSRQFIVYKFTSDFDRGVRLLQCGIAMFEQQGRKRRESYLSPAHSSPARCPAQSVAGSAAVREAPTRPWTRHASLGISSAGLSPSCGCSSRVAFGRSRHDSLSERFTIPFANQNIEQTSRTLKLCVLLLKFI